MKPPTRIELLFFNVTWLVFTMQVPRWLGLTGVRSIAAFVIAASAGLICIRALKRRLYPSVNSD